VKIVVKSRLDAGSWIGRILSLKGNIQIGILSSQTLLTEIDLSDSLERKKGSSRDAHDTCILTSLLPYRLDFLVKSVAPLREEQVTRTVYLFVFHV
jgi:hypothetical protein